MLRNLREINGESALCWKHPLLLEMRENDVLIEAYCFAQFLQHILQESSPSYDYFTI